MSEKLIQRFREALEEDIVSARGHLQCAINLPLEDYADGEIFMSKAKAKHSSIRDAERRLDELTLIYNECFPSEKFIRDRAMQYFWERDERKVT